MLTVARTKKKELRKKLDEAEAKIVANVTKLTQERLMLQLQT